MQFCRWSWPGWKAASIPAQLAGFTDLSVPGSPGAGEEALGEPPVPTEPPGGRQGGPQVLVAGGLCSALGGLGDPPWGAETLCIPPLCLWGPVVT